MIKEPFIDPSGDISAYLEKTHGELGTISNSFCYMQWDVSLKELKELK